MHDFTHGTIDGIAPPLRFRDVLHPLYLPWALTLHCICRPWVHSPRVLGLWALERAWRLFRASRLNGGVITDAKLPDGSFASGRQVNVRVDRPPQKLAPSAQELAWNFQSRNSSDGDTVHSPPHLKSSENVILQPEPVAGTKFREFISSQSVLESTMTLVQSNSFHPPTPAPLSAPHHDNPLNPLPNSIN